MSHESLRTHRCFQHARLLLASLAVFATLVAASKPVRAEPLASAATGQRDDDLINRVRAVVAAEGDDFAKALAGRLIEHTRRSLTLGPFAGLAYGPNSDGDSGLQVSFGLGLQRYRVPLLPEPSRLKEIFVERAVELLKQRLQGGQPLTEGEKQRLARQVWNEVKQEFLGRVRRKTFERPSWRVAGQVSHLTESGAWDLGLVAGFGISRVMVSTGPTLRWDDGAVLVAPLELSVPVLLTESLRAPVVDVFARAEFAVNDREDNPDVYLFGARFTLDAL